MVFVHPLQWQGVPRPPASAGLPAERDVGVVGEAAVEAAGLVEVGPHVGFRRAVVDPALQRAAAAQLDIDPGVRAAYALARQAERAQADNPADAYQRR